MLTFAELILKRLDERDPPKPQVVTESDWKRLEREHLEAGTGVDAEEICPDCGETL